MGHRDLLAWPLESALPPIQCEWGVCRATCTSGRWSYEGPCLFDAGVGVDD
jgi:hypothetical protein